MLADYRSSYKKKEKASGLAVDEEHSGNCYTAFAMKKDWTPEDDKRDDGGVVKKMWYRWDWSLEVNSNYLSNV